MLGLHVHILQKPVDCSFYAVENGFFYEERLPSFSLGKSSQEFRNHE